LQGAETVSARSGRVPGFIDVQLAPDQAADLRIELEYVGQAVTSPLGLRTATGKPYRFGYRNRAGN
jgi:hypothetical protein